MAATTEPAAGVRQLSCQVNGEQVQLDLPKDDGLTLLDVLRDFLGITSPKNGCSPQAQTTVQFGSGTPRPERHCRRWRGI